MKKKLSSALITLTIFVAGTPASVATYTDVPQNAWYAGYVQELREAGIVDAGEFFRPEQGLNRAELIKMVITATGGLKGYTPPPNPTFDDVPEDSWFFNYVEFAATKGITAGYADAQGNLIGLFGPADAVSRAAAAKILVQAFNLERLSVDESGFRDVRKGDWFYDHVTIAGQHGVISGYENGHFGPHDPVTRAQMAKMLALVLKSDMVENDDPSSEAVAETVETENFPSQEEATPNPAPLAEANIFVNNSQVLAAKYNFQAKKEGFRIEKVTIVNDITGELLGDETEGTPAIKNIILKFPNEEGTLSTATRSLGSDGKARFSNLDFFAKRDADTFFEVYAELNAFSQVGQSLSGRVFRLGIQDVSNDANSFRAVGNISGFVIGYGGSGNLTVSNARTEPFTVRKSLPEFTLNTTSSTMNNGENILISYNVSANPAGSIGLARLVLEVSAHDSNSSGLSLSDFRLFRGSGLVSEVNIYDATGSQDLKPGSGNSLTDGASFVIVTFNREELVSAGDTNIYSLRATLSGVEKSDSVSTRLAQGDENIRLSGLMSVNQENTGKIYVEGDPAAGIFTSSGDFAQTLGTAKNIIWSDLSADLHLYPQITGGVATSDSGSADWTNGYLLKLSSLEPHVISK